MLIEVECSKCMLHKNVALLMKPSSDKGHDKPPTPRCTLWEVCPLLVCPLSEVSLSLCVDDAVPNVNCFGLAGLGIQMSLGTTNKKRIS